MITSGEVTSGAQLRGRHVAFVRLRRAHQPGLDAPEEREIGLGEIGDATASIRHELLAGSLERLPLGASSALIICTTMLIRLGKAKYAVVTAVPGIFMAFVTLYAGYLTRRIVTPIRRAAGMAGRVAAGDLAARLPETGLGEIGSL